MDKYAHLLKPLKIGGITLKNRMFSSPTSLAELGPEEHYSRENIEYYKLRALGGAAVVPVGDVIVDLDTGRSHPQQVGMNDPSAIPYFCAVADAIHAGGAMAEVELDHGGALCSPEFIGGRNAIGPSGYVDPWGDTVEEMTEEQIYLLADMAWRRASKLPSCWTGRWICSMSLPAHSRRRIPLYLCTPVRFKRICSTVTWQQK